MYDSSKDTLSMYDIHGRPSLGYFTTMTEVLSSMIKQYTIIVLAQYQ